MARRTLFVAAAVVVLAVIAIAPVAAAITRFTDVPDTNIFAGDIKWMDDNGVTRGCGPDLFCPGANVTREQMSAFLHRLATDQVVDAGTLEGQTAADFAAAGHDHDSDYVAQTGSVAEASDLVRVESYTFTGPKTKNDYAIIGTFDIEAPVDGFLILSVSLEYRTVTTSDTVYCGFELDDTFVNNSSSRETVYNPTTPFVGSCDSGVVTPVTEGSHSINVLGTYDSAFDTSFDWGSASALFVPFDGSGMQPAAFIAAEPPASQLP